MLMTAITGKMKMKLTTDEIIRMAREAGLHKMIRHDWKVEAHTETLSPKLERFAALVAEATKAQPQEEKHNKYYYDFDRNK